MSTIPERYKNAKWEDVPNDLKKVIDEASKARRGVYIHGDVGTGKTHIAWAIKDRYDKPEYGRRAIVWNTTELLREMRLDFDRSYGEKMWPERMVMEHQGLVILDDVGAEKITDWVAETFYLIVNKRYNEVRPTIYTSNLPIQDLAERIGDRTVSRIVEMCDIVELVGKDRRIANKSRIKIQT